MKKHGFHQKKLQLLHDITGAFGPGILTALMGVSGAGKTTLMDVLSGRKTGGTIEGETTLMGASFVWFLLSKRWGTAGWIGTALVLGGSLLVQIYGSSSADKSIEAEDRTPKGNLFMIPDLDKQKLGNNIFASLVGVRTKKDVTDILK